jgi:hypothetical protein
MLGKVRGTEFSIRFECFLVADRPDYPIEPARSRLTRVHPSWPSSEREDSVATLRISRQVALAY